MTISSSGSTPLTMSIAAFVFLALHGIAISGETPLWGVDSLAFLPGWMTLTFAALAVVVVLPWTSRALVATRFVPRDPRLVSALLLGASAVLYLALPSRAHLLGDAQLLLSNLAEVSRGAPLPESHAPSTFVALQALHGLPHLRDSIELTVRVASWLAGGLFLVAAPLAARAVGRDATERAIVLALLLTSGFVQLFCGYVELYAPLVPATLLVLAAGIAVVRGRLSPLLLAVLLGIFLSVHFILVFLLPSLIWAVVRRPAGSRADTVARWAATPLAIAVALAALHVAGTDLVGLLRREGAAAWLPVLNPAGDDAPYGVLSPAHGLDVLNEYLLVAPAALLLLPAILRRRLPRTTQTEFLLVSAVFPVVFTLFVNPKLGAFRDWDALCFAVVPLMLWAAAVWLRSRDDRGDTARPTARAAARAALPILGAAALHTLAWLAVNTLPDAAEARFEARLTNDRLTSFARANGWENLGRHYREGANGRAALRAYEHALHESPTHPRYWSLAGVEAFKVGDARKAEQYLRRAVTLNPSEPDFAYNLGQVLAEAGQNEESIQQFLRVMELDPRNVEGWFWAGVGYANAREIEDARRCFQRVLELAPKGPRADPARRWLREYEEQSP